MLLCCREWKCRAGATRTGMFRWEYPFESNARLYPLVGCVARVVSIPVEVVQWSE